jgi:hypothetical protein
MTTLLVLLLTALQGQMTTTTKAAQAPPLPGSTVEGIVEADPDVVLRGRTVKIIVKGSDMAALKTLQVNPPEGIRLGVITPLPARPDGSAAVSVELHVDSSAEPGERTLTLIVAPTISTTSAARPGGASVPPEMQKLFEAVTKRETIPIEGGLLYINSHELTITKVDVERRAPFAVRIAVTDAEGDFQPSGPRTTSTPQPDAISVLGASSDLLISEARCGKDIFDSVVDDAVVRERQGSSVPIAGTLAASALEGAGPCELRVRVRDSAGNTSPWFKMKINLR